MRTWALSHEYVLIWVDLLAGRKQGVQLDIASIPDVFDAKAEENGTVLQQSWHIDFIWSCRCGKKNLSSLQPSLNWFQWLPKMLQIHQRTGQRRRYRDQDTKLLHVALKVQQPACSKITEGSNAVPWAWGCDRGELNPPRPPLLYVINRLFE